MIDLADMLDQYDTGQAILLEQSVIAYAGRDKALLSVVDRYRCHVFGRIQ